MRALFLQLEVGTDPGFSQLVHQADQITPGGDGRTVYRLPEPLGAGFTYYWRTRASDGANTGPYSAVSNFNVVPPVVIDTPTPTEPQGNINTNRPEFKVRNGAISGTTGVVYRIHVSTSADFSQTVALVDADAERQRHHHDVTRRAALQHDVLLARVGHRRREGIDPLEHGVVQDARGSHADGAAWIADGRRSVRPWRAHAGSTRRPAALAGLWCQRRPGRGAREPGVARQLVPGARRFMAVHGSRGRHAAHLRHPLGL